MEIINEFIQVLDGKNFSIPLVHVVIGLVFLAGCLFWGWYKVGVTSALATFFYWASVSNQSVVMDVVSGNGMGMLIVISAGLSMVMAWFIGVVRETY